MRRRRKTILQLCSLWGLIIIILYYSGDMLFLNKANWKMQTFPKDYLSPDLQYFSPRRNIYYGRKFDVNSSVLHSMNLNLHREDFVRVTDNDAHEFVIVTASDSWHYGGVFSMISTIQSYVPDPKIIVYNLGMTAAEMGELSAACGVVITEFEFRKYPDHVRNLNNYAWKPLMIHEALNEYPSVLWLDSSVRVISPYWIPVYDTAILTDGFVMFMGTDYSTYAVTHPTMYQYLPSNLHQLQHTVQREAGEVLVYRTESVYQNIVYWWVLCALDPNCIAPTRNGVCIWELQSIMDFLYCHKFDQSALNILASNQYDFQLQQLEPKYRVFTFVRHGPKEGKIRPCSDEAFFGPQKND